MRLHVKLCSLGYRPIYTLPKTTFRALAGKIKHGGGADEGVTSSEDSLCHVSHVRAQHDIRRELRLQSADRSRLPIAEAQRLVLEVIQS